MTGLPAPAKRARTGVRDTAGAGGAGMAGAMPHPAGMPPAGRTRPTAADCQGSRLRRIKED